MAKVETRQKRAAGATKPNETDVKGKLVDFLWHLRKQGYKDSTAKRKAKSLKWLVGLGADIFNPENVKGAIAKKRTWSDSTKVIVCDDYTTFLDMLGLTWQKPRYKRAEKLPFIPLESEIDALINACGRKVGAFLQGLKDTGADPGELAGVEWTDINLQNKTVTINHPVKGHNPRILSISNEFLQRISTFKKDGARIFNYPSIATNYYRQRKNVARKLNNPRIKKISLTTFRHWKATMEYHKTKDIIHVKQLLGHKSIQNTMVYINLEAALFDETCDDFTVRIANTSEEIKQLLEVGFEYVCNKNGLVFFRKRK